MLAMVLCVRAPINLQEFIKVKYKILIFGLSGHCPDLRPGLTWSCSGWNWIKLESVYLDSPYATARYDAMDGFKKNKVCLKKIFFFSGSYISLGLVPYPKMVINLFNDLY